MPQSTITRNHLTQDPSLTHTLIHPSHRSHIPHTPHTHPHTPHTPSHIPQKSLTKTHPLTSLTHTLSHPSHTLSHPSHTPSHTPHNPSHTPLTHPRVNQLGMDASLTKHPVFIDADAVAAEGGDKPKDIFTVPQQLRQHYVQVSHVVTPRG